MNRIGWLIGIVFLVGIFFVACAAAPSLPAGTSKGATAPEAKPATGAPSAPDVMGMRSGAADPAAQPLTPQGQAADQSKGGQTQTSDPLKSVTDRMIIYTAQLSLLVGDVARAVDDVTRVARETGGMVFGTNLSQKGDQQIATVTIRVPADQYTDAMSRLRGLANKVQQESSSAQDVGEEFADLDAQSRNLQAVEARYTELLNRAQTIDEILRVQQQINSVRSQIDRIKGRMQYLERQSAMATITVTMNPLPMEQGPKPSEWSAVRVAREAWQASLAVLQVLAEGVIRVVVFGWWFIPVLAALLWWRRGDLRRVGSRPAA